MQLRTVFLPAHHPETQFRSSQEVCDAFIDTLHSLIDRALVDRDTLGLYLVSPNAGSEDACGFWSQALDQGPGLVSPLGFPWTLSNAPAAYIARSLAIHGPNITLAGTQLSCGLPLARMHLRSNICPAALLVFLSIDTHYQAKGLALLMERQTASIKVA